MTTRSPGLQVVRVVGPPGSGKTLLITSLVEALRARGHLVARSSPRGDRATVIVMTNGGRVTVERALGLDALRTLVPSLDPRAGLLLAEGVEGPGAPAVALVPQGASAPAGGELLAAVSSTQVAGDFATFGPGETHGLADVIEERVLGVQREQPRRRGLLGRLRGLRE